MAIDWMNHGDNQRIRDEALKHFVAACLEKLGVQPNDASLTADNMLFANLRGVDSHGIIRLKIYADRLRQGGIDPRARPQVIKDDAAVGLIEAGGGVGQVAGAEAMRLAIEKARRHNVGLVNVRNSNHFGAAAYFAMMALEPDMIGVALTNASPTIAPTGGRQARLGNNPIAVAVPAGKEPPIVLDMASGAVAKGKIFLAQQEKKKIPLNWALDANGLPTDDPDAAAAGLIQPLGGYKGYGISLMIDVLTGVLSQGGYSTGVDQMYGNLAGPTNTCHSLAAIRIDSFLPAREFRATIDSLILLMRSTPLAAGADEIKVPGEIEHETELERRRLGVPISHQLIDELKDLGRSLGVAHPF